MPRKTEEEWFNMLYRNYLLSLKEKNAHYQTNEQPKTLEEFKATYPHKNPYNT